MIHLLLTADPLGFAAQGVAGYLFYVRAVCYAIAAVICIVGALSVYSAIIDAHEDHASCLLLCVPCFCEYGFARILRVGFNRCQCRGFRNFYILFR